MKARPLVSVIIPAYNAEKTIHNAIDSVLRQTITDFEVIAVDDKSDDSTAQAVEGVPDPRVRLLRTAANSGPSGARNLGVKDARGRWVAFLDADDEWVLDRLEYLIAAAGHETDCFVTDRVAMCVPGSKGNLAPLTSTHPLSSDGPEPFDFCRYVELAVDVKPIVTRGSLVRHRIEFPEWGSGGDWAFFIARLSACGVKGKLVHRAGYLYRVTGPHDSSRLRAIEEQLSVQELLASDPSVLAAARELLKRGVPGIRKRLVVAALREGNWDKFAHYVSKNPTDLLVLPGSVLHFLWRRIRYVTLHTFATAPHVPGTRESV